MHMRKKIFLFEVKYPLKYPIVGAGNVWKCLELKYSSVEMLEVLESIQVLKMLENILVLKCWKILVLKMLENILLLKYWKVSRC